MENNPLNEALAALHKVNEQFNALAPRALPQIRSAIRTFKLLTTYVGADEWRKEPTESGFRWVKPGRYAMEELKRPPVALTAQLFKKNEE